MIYLYLYLGVLAVALLCDCGAYLMELNENEKHTFLLDQFISGDFRLWQVWKYLVFITILPLLLAEFCMWMIFRFIYKFLTFVPFEKREGRGDK